MSDPNAPNSSSTDQASTGPSGNWRDQRRAERDARRGARREMMGHSWGGGMPMGGLIILVVGVVFLASNFGFHLPDHWWAVFVLIPAAAALVSAVRFFRMDGTMSARATGSAIGGVVMLAIALALFLGVNWGVFWPVILIVVGLGIVARGYWQR